MLRDSVAAPNKRKKKPKNNQTEKAFLLFQNICLNQTFWDYKLYKNIKNERKGMKENLITHWNI